MLIVQFFSVNNNMNLFKDIENDKFMQVFALLDLFPNNDTLIVNNHLVYSEYLPMGLTQETRLNRISNPVSAVAVYRKFLESKKFFFSRFIFKSLINYYRFNLHAKNKIYIANESFSNIFIRFSALNIAKIICLYDKLIIKIKFLYNDYFKTS